MVVITSGGAALKCRTSKEASSLFQDLSDKDAINRHTMRSVKHLEKMYEVIMNERNDKNSNQTDQRAVGKFVGHEWGPTQAKWTTEFFLNSLFYAVPKNSAFSSFILNLYFGSDVDKVKIREIIAQYDIYNKGTSYTGDNYAAENLIRQMTITFSKYPVIITTNGSHNQNSPDKNPTLATSLKQVSISFQHTLQKEVIENMKLHASQWEYYLVKNAITNTLGDAGYVDFNSIHNIENALIKLVSEKDKKITLKDLLKTIRPDSISGDFNTVFVSDQALAPIKKRYEYAENGTKLKGIQEGDDSITDYNLGTYDGTDDRKKIIDIYPVPFKERSIQLLNRPTKFWTHNTINGDNDVSIDDIKKSMEKSLNGDGNKNGIKNVTRYTNNNSKGSGDVLDMGGQDSYFFGGLSDIHASHDNTIKSLMNKLDLSIEDQQHINSGFTEIKRIFREDSRVTSHSYFFAYTVVDFQDEGINLQDIDPSHSFYNKVKTDGSGVEYKKGIPGGDVKILYADNTREEEGEEEGGERRDAPHFYISVRDIPVFNVTSDLITETGIKFLQSNLDSYYAWKNAVANIPYLNQYETHPEKETIIKLGLMLDSLSTLGEKLMLLIGSESYILDDDIVSILSPKTLKTKLLNILIGSRLKVFLSGAQRTEGQKEDEVIGLLRRQAKSNKLSFDAFNNVYTTPTTDQNLEDKKILSFYLILLESRNNVDMFENPNDGEEITDRNWQQLKDVYDKDETSRFINKIEDIFGDYKHRLGNLTKLPNNSFVGYDLNYTAYLPENFVPESPFLIGFPFIRDVSEASSDFKSFTKNIEAFLKSKSSLVKYGKKVSSNEFFISNFKKARVTESDIKFFANVRKTSTDFTKDTLNTQKLIKNFSKSKQNTFMPINNKFHGVIFDHEKRKKNFEFLRLSKSDNFDENYEKFIKNTKTGFERIVASVYFFTEITKNSIIDFISNKISLPFTMVLIQEWKALVSDLYLAQKGGFGVGFTDRAWVSDRDDYDAPANVIKIRNEFTIGPFVFGSKCIKVENIHIVSAYRQKNMCFAFLPKTNGTVDYIPLRGSIKDSFHAFKDYDFLQDKLKYNKFHDLGLERYFDCSEKKLKYFSYSEPSIVDGSVVHGTSPLNAFILNTEHELVANDYTKKKK